jgi:4-diphosphocytidyl-2-C-methyl-D-erythritol kinase
LNELFGHPLKHAELHPIAASLGSDIPFFLQNKPALATGRGESVMSLDRFPALAGFHILLIHPGFGVSTAWAYKNLARFSAALNGERSRAARLVGALEKETLEQARPDFYNSLEAPVLEKFPLLTIIQKFLKENGASITMMSGSGSTTFALVPSEPIVELLKAKFVERFGSFCWVKSVPL